MLDLTRPVDLPDPAVAGVYQDHAVSGTYYLVPSTPTLADDDGRPEGRLLLFLSRSGATRVPVRATLTLTTTLRLPAGAQERVRRALERRLAAAGESPDPTARRLELRDPDWVGGTVEVVPMESIVLTGQPALVGDNRCAVSAALTAEQARALRRQWDQQLPAGRIVYRMVMRAATTRAATRVATESTRATTPRAATTADRATTVRARVTTAVNHAITLAGPLWTPGLDRAVRELEL
jgi:hypothetical protein